MSEKETIDFVLYLWAEHPNLHISEEVVKSYYNFTKSISVNDAYRIADIAKLRAERRYGPATSGELEEIRKAERRVPLYHDKPISEHDAKKVIDFVTRSGKYKKLMGANESD